MSQETSVALQQEHPRHFISASLVFGRNLMEMDTDEERKARKQRVLERRLAMLREAVPEITTLDIHDVKAPGGFPREHAAALFVDLAFSVPFAPYELKVAEGDHPKALRRTGTDMGFGKALMDRVEALKREAAAAHTHGIFSSPWTLIAAGVLVAAAIPILPVVAGSGLGLAGAALTSHGLAVLGGGSLAVGGYGMAGGAWVLTGLGGAAATTAGIGAGKLLRGAGPEALRVEVAKAQTTAVLHMESGAWTRDDVSERLHGFDEFDRELSNDLAEETSLNDTGSARIRTLEEKRKILKVARDWIAERMG
jgi:hypothetical protein